MWQDCEKKKKKKKKRIIHKKHTHTQKKNDCPKWKLNCQKTQFISSNWEGNIEETEY